MMNPCLNSIRFVTLALWAAAAFWWREPQTQPLPVQVPTQVRMPDPAPVSITPVSVLAKPKLELATGVCPPIKKVTPKAIPVLTDLYHRVGNPDYFADPNEPDDLVTHVHELTHGVSNRLHASTVKHGIYLLDGKGIVLKHPKVTIEQVANSIPKAERGRIFDLYLVQQRKDWNKSPIYLLDEHNAYIHGTLAHRQLGLGVKRRETYDHAREMERYVRQLVKVVERHDPAYPDMEKLKTFVEWQSDRLDQFAQMEPVR
jgi:hypothetical protein